MAIDLENEAIVQKMRWFYEVFPYPNRPVFLSPHISGSLLSHAGFSALLCQNRIPLCEEIWAYSRSRGSRFSASAMPFLEQETAAFPAAARILLVGCGTDEPLLFRTLHPGNEIVGIDLSAKSVQRAAFKIRFQNFRRRLLSFAGDAQKTANNLVTLLQGDAVELCQSKALGQFDHIQCFGVLHHQPQPEVLMNAMADSLKPGGTMRLMIYSLRGRRLERRIQGRYTSMWRVLDTSLKSRILAKLHNFKLLVWLFASRVLRKNTAPRFRYLGLSSVSVADALMHPSDKGLGIAELSAMADKNHLKMIFCEGKIDSHAWISGFGETGPILGRLKEADEKEGLESNFIAIFRKEK